MRKPILAVALLAVLAAACGPAGIGVRGGRPEGLAFITQVVDITDDSGDGVSLTTDADGNPHLAYLSFLPDPVEGEPPPAVDPLGVLVPAVKHAHFVNDTWTRTVVRDTPLGLEEDEGAEEPALTTDDSTDIALDGEGVHHIVWTASGGLFYSNNAEGSFSKSELVAELAAKNPAIAVGEDGSVWVSFYGGDFVLAARRTNDGWITEEIGTGSTEDPRTTGIALAGDDPLVVYADRAGVKLARRGPNGWPTETVDEEGGGGLSLALDGDGNAHVSYYAADQVRHAHSIEGSPWDISAVGETSGPDPESRTSIALDEAGIHHIAWDDGEGIAYANNEGGQFEEEDVPGSAGGVQPAIGAGAEGVAAVGWYQPKEELLKLAIRSEEEPLLAVPVEEPGAGPGGTPSAECEPDGTDLAITAPSGAISAGFATDCLAAPVGEAFAVEFTNEDSGVPHNLTIYPGPEDTDPSSALGGAGGASNTITGPDTTTYDVDPLEEGAFFFQCDVHPTTMTGTFVVA